MSAFAEPPAPAASTPPVVAASAVAIVDDDTGALLYGLNAHERRAQASLTKMTTALVALEHAPVSVQVQATQNSMTIPAVIGMDPGDVLSLHDALYGLLLNSGNDVALAIAESVGRGSISRFVGWMNAWAASHGLRDTHYVNPHGLDADGQYSSAYDVALVGRALLRNELLASVVATKRYEVPGPPLWVFHNINPLLGQYPGVDGLKTGYETNAGHCLAVSATRAGHRIIVVILNDDNRVQDARALLDWSFGRFRWWTVRVPASDGYRTVAAEVVLPRSDGRYLATMVRLERATRIG